MSEAKTFPLSIIGVDVGGTKIACGVVEYTSPDEKPQVVCRKQIATLAQEGGEVVLARIESLVDDVRAAYGKPVAAIGIATAGHVNSKTFAIDIANDILPGWQGQPVGSAVAKSSGLPCVVLNDVQGHALGEARWGAGRGKQNVVMVAAGTGVGGAFVVNGKLLTGTHGYAGEVGHMIHPLAEPMIGEREGIGSLELVASGSGLEYCYTKAKGQHLSGGEISAQADVGDATAIEVVENAGFALGENIAVLVELFDPEVVVISGSVFKAGERLMDKLKEGYMRQTQRPEVYANITKALLGDDAPLFGAAEYACDRLELRA